MLKALKIAAAAGLLAGPALAADISIVEPTPLPEESHHSITAHLEMGLGYQDANFFGDTWNFDGAGRFNVAFGNNLNLQVDLVARSFFDDFGSNAIAIPLAHLWHGSDSHAFGVYGGAVFGSGPGVGFEVGAEGEYYFGSSTLGGRASYSFSDNLPFSVWGFEGWGAHYVTPDLKLSGGVLALLADASNNDPAWNFWGEVERRHSGKPYSGFVRAGYYTQKAFLGTASGWSAMAGFRLFADDPATTLRQHDMQVPWKHRDGNLIVILLTDPSPN